MQGIWPNTEYTTCPDRPYVTSNAGFPDHKWWDYPVLHPVFSYTSWIGMILEDFGHPGFKRLHKKVFKR